MDLLANLVELKSQAERAMNLVSAVRRVHASRPTVKLATPVETMAVAEGGEGMQESIGDAPDDVKFEQLKNMARASVIGALRAAAAVQKSMESIVQKG